jgi:hypothetical protein
MKRAIENPWARAVGAATLVWITVTIGGGVEPARAADLQYHGLLDLVISQRGPAFDGNIFTRGDSPFDPAGVRLFADSRVNDRAQVFAQVVLHDASSLYLDGAYLMYSPFASRDLHLLAGKVPWAIGTWGPRTYSTKNPLIGTPLIYSHPTTLLWYDLPTTTDALLATAGSGGHGVNYHGYAEGRGMPVVDDSYWDVGLTVAGSQRPLEYALGVVAGTPSWASTSEDDNSGKCVLGRLGLAPAPWLRLGVSGAYGPYLHASLDARMPAGHSVNDYAQKLAMADLELLVGHVEIRAEGARNFWETPTVGTLSVTGGYVESKLATPWSTFLAGRYDMMRFGKITESTGEREPWDDDTDRLEAGLGYRFSRDVTGKLIYQRTRYAHEMNDSYPTLELFATQLSVAF